MCGFVCLWKIDDVNLARRMIGKIAHRGPDELQVRQAPGVPAVMAHCRLSIIGPTAGTQPIYSADNLLVANGEIYNYADLRAILGEAAFTTQSDSETILHLFNSGAMRWISRLDGMFAFVLATPERIVAARDPLGIKPLFMARMGDGLAFASELKAFDGLGFDSVEAIAPGTLYDSRDRHPRLVPHAPGRRRAAAGRSGRAGLARTALRARGGGAQVDGRRRRGRLLPLRRARFARSSPRSPPARSTSRSRPSRSASPAVPTSPRPPRGGAYRLRPP